MVGNNTPVFFIRDPMKFPDFIHTQKRDPQSNLKSPDAFWDFHLILINGLIQEEKYFLLNGILEQILELKI